MNELRFNVGDIVVMNCDYWYNNVDLEITELDEKGYIVIVQNSDENRVILRKNLSIKDVSAVLDPNFTLYVHHDHRLSKSIKLCYPDE